MDCESETPSRDGAGGCESVFADGNRIGVDESPRPNNSTPEIRTRLEWAQWMAAKGISVFIVTPKSKRPLEGQSWYLRQSTDPDVIETLFSQTENCNYGLHLGERYVAIDLDVGPNKDGVREFEAICRENDIDDFRLELDTLMSRTPGGGYHLFFKTPLPCANRNYFPDGIDVRGVQGYVVGPGSEDSRGKWEIVDPSAEIADLPDWLLAYVEEPNQRHEKSDSPVVELDLPENVEHAVEWLREQPPAIEGENGNDRTYEVAGFLRDFGLSETKMLEVLNVEWNQRCEPHWDDAELETLIANVWKYAQNRPGIKSPAWQAQRVQQMQAWWSDAVAKYYPRLAVDYTALAAAEDDIPEGDSREPVRRRSFKPRSEAEQDAQPDPEWLIKGVLPKECLALFYGRENSFKSFLVLDMVLSAAVGRPWASYGGSEDAGGFAPKRPLTTVYIAGEGAHGIEKLRRPAWRQHRDVTEPLPFYTVSEMPFFKSDDEVDRLIAEIREANVEPDIIVVDTAARAMLDLDENSAKDTGVFVAACDRLKREFHCAVVVVHHSGKDNAKGARGSTNLPASFDVRFLVTGDTGSLAARIVNEKQKDGEPWSRPITFQGEQVAISPGKNSLVFGRVASGVAKVKDGDPLLDLATAIVAEYQGKMPLSMNALAEEMARCYATEELSGGELEKSKEAMRRFLRREITGRLASYAHKAGKAKSAPWVFEDRTRKPIRALN